MDTVSFTRPIDDQIPKPGLETAIAKAFKNVFEEQLQQRFADLVDYGCPHLGSPAVVERFTKQNGLVVLRRRQTSDKLMRIIYANWTSLSSERGLAFLEFVLKMIWTDQFQIKRMWHPISSIESYPKYITEMEKPDHFLTSRIRISIDESVSLAEIVELSPMLRNLVPANIVVKVHSRALDRDLGVSNLGVAIASKAFQIIDLSDFKIAPKFGPWQLHADILINSAGIAKYSAYKTNNVEHYDSTAEISLLNAVIRSLSDADMQQWQAVKDACSQLTGVNDWVFDATNNRIIYKNTVDPDPISPSNAFYYILSGTGSNPPKFSTPDLACKYAFNIGRGKPVQASYPFYSHADGTQCYLTNSNKSSFFHFDNALKITNPAYDPTAVVPSSYISFGQIAQKIISNTTAAEPISLHAENYLLNVARSINSTDEQKQFVKMPEILRLLEDNKVLRK